MYPPLPIPPPSNLTFQQRFGRLQEAKENIETQFKGPKIQRVPHLLRDRTDLAEHYKPKLVSFGPIHHGAPNLQLGERYKQMWAAKYIDSTGQNPEALHNKIAENIGELKKLFDADLFTSNDQFSSKYYRDQGFKDMEEKICWTLFVDGCALLHILENTDYRQLHKMGIKTEDMWDVIRDVLLLENQLPYPLLKLLWRHTERMLMDRIEMYLLLDPDKPIYSPITDGEWAAIVESPPPHLLHLQRSIDLSDHDANQTQNNPNGDIDNTEIWHRNIKELKAAGIGLKKGKTHKPCDISFSHGRLHSVFTIPKIIVNSIVVDYLFNVIAYERCHDFENDYGISSYYLFLDSLIDDADDVKELKSQGILFNTLRSDEKVAEFFNTIGTTSVVEQGMKYDHVRAQIERHFSHKSLPTWLTLGYNTYFSNPWTIVAFLAAFVGLVLTFIQTWYSIPKTK